ncbi:MAG: hypothetical protein ABR499_16195, partial [Gemmatimonadaceae bacterium]
MSDEFDGFDGEDEGCGTDESLAMVDESRAGLAARETAVAAAGEADDAAADETAALLDAVRIEIRRGEIVITIRGEPLEAGAVPPPGFTARRLVTAARALAPPGIAPAIAGRTAAARIGAAAAARAGVAPVFVGLASVPADKFGAGFNNFTIRADLADSYRAVYRQVKALGGVLTSSGGIRDLGAGATAGRSRTSLHYTGRAIDLFIHTGMQGGSEPYLVTRDGGNHRRHHLTFLEHREQLPLRVAADWPLVGLHCRLCEA